MRRQSACASELDWWMGIRCAGWLHISRWFERQCHTHKNNRENRDQKNTQEGERHTRNRGINGEIKQWPWHCEKYSYTILHILCYFGSGSFKRKEVSGHKDTLYFVLLQTPEKWDRRTQRKFIASTQRVEVSLQYHWWKVWWSSLGGFAFTGGVHHAGVVPLFPFGMPLVDF